MSDDQLAATRQHQIGFVFQSFHLVPRMTSLENVELPMLLAGMPPAERHERGRQALAGVGLLERVDHRPAQLSGGERQRVAIARAIVMQPKLLLADEPTGNLDTASGAEVVRIMEDLNARGLTLVVVTHDAQVGERARRRLLLRDGRIVSDLKAAAA
jgi:putative ABC transport system ATP-binding protein